MVFGSNYACAVLLVIKENKKKNVEEKTQRLIHRGRISWSCYLYYINLYTFIILCIHIGYSIFLLIECPTIFFIL